MAGAALAFITVCYSILSAGVGNFRTSWAHAPCLGNHPHSPLTPFILGILAEQDKPHEASRPVIARQAERLASKLKSRCRAIGRSVALEIHW